MNSAHYPGGTTKSKLTDEELKEIIKYSLPMSWRKQMTLQHFHCYDKTIDKVIDFCKDMEDYELAHPMEIKKKTSKTSQDKKPKSQKRTYAETESKDLKETRKYCKLHGYGHSTDECKVLNKEISKMKSEWSTKNSRFSKDSKFNPKSRFNKEDTFHINEIIDQRISKLQAQEEQRHQMEKLHAVATAESYNTMCIHESDAEDTFSWEYKYLERGHKGRPFFYDETTTDYPPSNGNTKQGYCGPTNKRVKTTSA